MKKRRGNVAILHLQAGFERRLEVDGTPPTIDIPWVSATLPFYEDAEIGLDGISKVMTRIRFVLNYAERTKRGKLIALHYKLSP